jgi:hypothetical protein
VLFPVKHSIIENNPKKCLGFPLRPKMQVSDAGYLVQRQETFIIAFVVWKRRSPG